MHYCILLEVVTTQRYMGVSHSAHLEDTTHKSVTSFDNASTTQQHIGLCVFHWVLKPVSYNDGLSNVYQWHPSLQQHSA